MTGEHWKIGELARVAGVTVRTLHHYDSVGLLVPSERSHRAARAAGTAAARRPASRAGGRPLEAMSMVERYYTLEQLEQLEQRRQRLGEEKIKQVEQEWADLYARLRELREAGVDPADPEPQALGRRAGELIELFTGGDPGIRASLQRMYEQEGPEQASRGVGSPEEFEYLNRIRAAASS